MKLLSTVIPYLLLVSFFSGQLTTFNDKQINIVNLSNYNGIAIPLIEAYNVNKYKIGDFSSQVNKLTQKCHKDIWPWVFFNRFVGFDPEQKSLSSKSNKDYFRRIKGMDLYNKNNALQDFFDIWAMALHIAKDLDSPGIVVDPELYNNYKAKNLSYLMKKMGKSKQEIISRLEQIGTELAELTDSIYPEAKIWFLFTGLGAKRNSANGMEYALSFSYIIKGMLQTIKNKKFKSKIIAGGESYPWGYCYESLSTLSDKINERYRSFAEEMNSFPALVLGGTIAPWAKVEDKKSWMLTREECKLAPQNNINDFKPYFNLLFKSYRYVWIYAASAAGFDPYDSERYPIFDKAFSDVLALFDDTTMSAPDNLHVSSITN